MILVTGATGLLGNNLVRRLVADREPVRVLVRPGSDPRPLEGLPVERALGDLLEPSSVFTAMSGVRGVIHAAADVRVAMSGGEAMHRVNVDGTRAVAAAAMDAGVRLLHVSSVDAQGWGTRNDPADETVPPNGGYAIPYCASKRAAEDVVAAAAELGLDAVIVRPAFLLGPWDWKPSSGTLLLGVARGAGRIAPPGGNDICHVEDVADGCLAAFRRGRTGAAYLLGGEALTYRGAFEVFAEVTGGPRPLVTAPAALVKAVGAAAGTLGRLVGREPDLNAATARMACFPHHVDDTLAREELGYLSRSAREAAEDAWVWLQEHGYA